MRAIPTPPDIVARVDPYTVVIVEGIRLPVYAVGGVNVSVGELVTVDHAQVYLHKASGAAFTTGQSGVGLIVTSGSGNVVTITALTALGVELPAAAALSGFPAAVLAYGH